MSVRFRLVSDDDGHEFIIPAGQREAFEQWLQSDEAMDGVVPSWARPINMHHSNYSFKDWREE